MSGWTCRHQDGENYCQRLRVGCRPGMVGCFLRGKTSFIYDEEGRGIPQSPVPVKKPRSRRGRKVSA